MIKILKPFQLPYFLKRNVVSHPSSPGKLVEVEEKNQELLIPGLEEGSGMHEREGLVHLRVKRGMSREGAGEKTIEINLEE